MSNFSERHVESNSNDDGKHDVEALYNSIKTILTATKNHQSAWPFQTPVDRKMVTAFYNEFKV